MQQPFITVDFHNTLVECDPWFNLEVYSLVSSVAKWFVDSGMLVPDQFDTKDLDESYRRLRHAVHQHGHEVDAVVGAHLVLSRHGVELERGFVAEAVESLMKETLEWARPVNGAVTFLENLAEQGASITIVSSAVYHPFLEWALERLGMRTFVGEVVTSSSSGYYKSRPEIYWAALAASTVAPPEATHIGDSLRFDVHGAATAGFRTAWFDRSGNGSTETETETMPPDIVVRSMADAADPVLNLSRSQRGL
ncbi:hypothetical protein BH23CHL5_BH23CHL5_11430 [soil metagenome]